MSRVLISIVLLLGAIAPVTLAQPLGAPAPLPPIAAKAWLLYDYQAGREIVASDRDERVEPASLTKLMVAYLIFSAIRHGQVALSQAVLVSPKAKATPGSRMYLTPEQPVTVDRAAARHDRAIGQRRHRRTGGDGRRQRRGVRPAHERASGAHWGSSGTHFANVTGLSDPHHYSTAADLLRLAVYVMRDYPEFYPLFAMHEYTYAGGHAAQSQRAAVSRSLRGRRQDRPHRRRGLLPHRVCQARRSSNDRNRDGHSIGARACHRGAKAAELRLRALRDGEAVREAARRWRRCRCGKAAKIACRRASCKTSMSACRPGRRRCSRASWKACSRCSHRSPCSSR